LGSDDFLLYQAIYVKPFGIAISLAKIRNSTRRVAALYLGLDAIYPPSPSFMCWQLDNKGSSFGRRCGSIRDED
jgi:hypothetical protein